MQVPKKDRHDDQARSIFMAWMKQTPELKTIAESIAAEYRKLPEPMTSVLHVPNGKGSIRERLISWIEANGSSQRMSYR